MLPRRRRPLRPMMSPATEQPFTQVTDVAFAEELMRLAANPPVMHPLTARRIHRIIRIMMDPNSGVDSHVCALVRKAVFPDPVPLTRKSPGSSNPT